LHLWHVLVSPHINLLSMHSMHSLTRDNSVCIEFDHDKFSIKYLQTKAMILWCESSSDLYHLPAGLPGLCCSSSHCCQHLARTLLLKLSLLSTLRPGIGNLDIQGRTPSKKILYSCPFCFSKSLPSSMMFVAMANTLDLHFLLLVLKLHFDLSFYIVMFRLHLLLASRVINIAWLF
jgi:hypothetical protein